MSLRYFTSAIALELDPQRCNGCRRCIEVCPHDVFRMIKANPSSAIGGSGETAIGTRVRFRAVIADRDRCMECGACALNCPEGAIRAGSGVGCAAAIINGMLRGTAPTCDCGAGSGCGSAPSSGPSCGGN